jgi:hypothetical protein
MKKNLIAILTAAVIMISFLSSAIIVSAGDPTTWYRTENGVLTTDSYSLYPFMATSLDIGFSKFGEMIDSNNNVGLQYPGFDTVGTYDQRLGTSRDPFANELVSKALWINGWLINVTYRNKIYMLTNPQLAFRNVWAFALFADGQAYGGDWNTNLTTATQGLGGRQTNKYAWTDDITPLYNGPRSFVAMMVTHINDTQGSASWELCDVVLTAVFDKVNKQVMLYKEVKLKLEPKYLDDLVDVQFSNRGEWDLGPSTGARSIESYAHIYWQYNDTSYDENWSDAKNLKRDIQDNFVGPGTANQTNIVLPHLNDTGGHTWYGYMLTCPSDTNPFVENTEHVFVNGVYKTPSTPRPYIILEQEGIPNPNPGDVADHGQSTDSWWIFFPHQFGPNDNVTILYKNYIKDTHPEGDSTDGHFPYSATDTDGNPHEYTLAQIISADTVLTGNEPKLPGTVVGYAAYWPVLSDYTPDGWTWALQSLLNLQAEDMGTEPSIPFLIGEWDFVLGLGGQFRGVTVYGITDYHDAQDAQMDAPYDHNVVDREVLYQLAQIFKPWDLTSAVQKDNTRWVDFTNDPITKPIGKTYFVLSHAPVMPIPDNQWDQYCTFSERVIDLNTSTVLRRYYTDYLGHWTWDYNFTVNTKTGVGNITGLIPTHCYKILYSTTVYDTIYPHLGGGDNDWGYVNVWRNGTLGGQYYNDTLPPPGQSETVTVGSSVLNSTVVINDYDNFTDKLGATVGLMMNDSFCTQLTNSTNTLNGTLQLDGHLIFNATELKVFKENIASGTLVELGDGWNTWQANVINSTDNALINLTKVGLYYTITPPVTTDQDGAKKLLDLHIDYAKIDLGYTINITYWRNATYWKWHLNWDFDLNAEITWHIPGTYEWTVLGRDAATSDSLGATLDTAALKNKQVEIGNAGEDMMYPEWGVATIPYVMNCFGTLPGTRTDYKWQLGALPLDPSCPGMRSALVDDWCTRWPVSSSDMLAVGGPLANMLAYYFNDFTDAFYGSNIGWLGEDFTPYAPWAGKLIALPCWSKNAYQDNATYGYATIGTYKDLNGTVGLLIWGMGPRDTYYTSKFFHDEIIYELQQFPPHVTSVIIQINYTDSKHPTFTMPEVLGTISERQIIAVLDDPAYRYMGSHQQVMPQAERPVPYWYPETSPIKGKIHVDP